MKKRMTGALALFVAAKALAASIIEVTPDNTPYKLEEDATDVTKLSIAENCVLDLNGHDLTYNGSGQGLSGVNGHSSTVMNSASTGSTLTIGLNISSSAFGESLNKMAVKGNTKLVVKGHSTGMKQLLGSSNEHTDGTTLIGVNPTTADLNFLDYQSYGRAYGAADFGSGPLVLKDGSIIHLLDGNGISVKWSALEVDNNKKSKSAVYLQNRINSTAPVKVAAGSTLLFVVNGSLPEWTSDFTEARGTIQLCNVNASYGGFVDAGTTGFPNGRIELLKSKGACQLRFKRGSNSVIEIGELATEETDGPDNNALVYNVADWTTQTLLVGGLNTDSTFNGNISKNANATLALEKTGTGTLTLGNANTYVGQTVLSGGVVKLTGDGEIGSGSTAAIVFNGGTLAFADDVAVTDYSARIKNSAKAISVDTAKDVIWSTALPCSNSGGLVKKGSGKLAVAGYSSYTGKTIVSDGTLSVGFDYNGTKDGINREFKVEDGAKLEVTLRNTSSTRPSTDILTSFPNGTTVNLEATDVNKGYPRWTDLSSLGWNGTVNFANSSAMGTAGGFVASASTFGSFAIGWGVTGAPESLTRVVDFEYNENANINLGSFNWPSENAGIFVKKSGNWNIDGRDEPSLLNGKLLTYPGVTVTINYNASSTLTIGSGFGAQLNEGQSGKDPKVILNVNNGTLVNNGDMAGIELNCFVGVKLRGTGKWPSYELGFPQTPDKANSYLLLRKAAGVPAPADYTAKLETVNQGVTGGKWIVVVGSEGDFTTYTLKFCAGFMLMVF